MSHPDAFSDSYAQARAKFLAAAANAGLAVQSYPHPLPGRDGEALATDVVLDGPANAEQLLIVSSACHGVEGFSAAACRWTRWARPPGGRRPMPKAWRCCMCTP